MRYGPGGLPRTLNPRHHLLAYLIAAGYSTPQACAAMRATGIRLSVGRANIVRLHPEFKQLVRRLQEEKMSGALSVIIHRLTNEALPSLNKMAALRDGASEERVQLRAAGELYTAFERAAGIGAARHGEDRGPLVQINLTERERSHITSILSEARLETPRVTVSQESRSLSTRTVHELINELGPIDKHVEVGSV